MRLGKNQMNYRTQSMPNTGYAVPPDKEFLETFRSSSSSKSKSAKRSSHGTAIALLKRRLLANRQGFS